MSRIMPTELRWAFNALAWQPNQTELLTALSAVSPDESNRIQKFHFQEDYKLSLSGRLMIRKCVNHLLKIPWHEIKLTRSNKGKPQLAGVHNLYFNVSHQGNYTVLGASLSHNLGIDIMKFVYPNNTDIPSFFRLMRRQFTEEEWEYIMSFPNEWTQLKGFYRLWCLKESYVKATGEGIGTDSARYMRFHIHTRELAAGTYCSDSILYINNVKLKNWTFTEHLLDSEHIVATATNTCEPITDCFRQLDIDELLHSVKIELTVSPNCWDAFMSKHTRGK